MHEPPARSTGTNRFELGLLVGRSATRIVTLAELLELAATDAALPTVRLDDATLLLEADDRDLMPTPWVIGDVATMGEQFAAAAERLRDGQPAIVRSAVDDREAVDYFLFEPGDHSITVSTFHAPTHLHYIYPTAPRRGQQLYDEVEASRDELLASHVDGQIHGVTFPADWLIDALVTEADRCGRVATLLRIDPA